MPEPIAAVTQMFAYEPDARNCPGGVAGISRAAMGAVRPKAGSNVYDPFNRVIKFRLGAYRVCLFMTLALQEQEIESSEKAGRFRSSCALTLLMPVTIFVASVAVAAGGSADKQRLLAAISRP